MKQEPATNHEQDTSETSDEAVSEAVNTAADKTVEAVDSDEQRIQQEDKQLVVQQDEFDIDHTTFTPRGTLLFLLVMLVGYALYWAYLWFIVVIERGAGGA
jgi:hypothetical protein